ncbi:superinfection exclusion B family protein [Shewanella yunxiaonensis]|uniref:Superinfection exclusion B family protein n=1 Tax=Shewanella yunxiaonensis TaxID=2829809 RepID=A0ABX7YW18_9GAMM|nr:MULTISPECIES: superinfection exclusion B family protein [Shewanella]MDF0533060.1 superinfection exclusion B family protein [Shewanella sp. A32]QUN06351.1 superinfection exclusion B family protein [Shewanella yunxiaonensis]
MKRFKLTLPKTFSVRGLLLGTALWGILLTTLLLFTPSPLLHLVNLDLWVADNGHYIGLGLLCAVAYIGALIVNFLLDEAIHYLQGRRVDDAIEEKVLLLDPAERALLREFFLQGSAVLTMPKEDMVVQSLLNTHILECVGNERHYAIQGPTADFKISMKARRHLNRRVLRLPAGELSKEDMQHLMKARPQFINSLAQVRKHAA